MLFMSLAFHIQIGPSHLLSRVRRLPWILFAWSAAVVVFDRVDSMASELPRLVTVSGVLRLPWLTVLMMIPRSRDEASDAGWRVFVGRDAVNDDAWCALRRWLRWLERGSHGC